MTAPDAGRFATVVVRPIQDEDAGDVAQFLHENLNARVPRDAWLAMLQPPWRSAGPDHGRMLLVDGRLVGVYAAVYSKREVGGTEVALCNLAAFCVLEPHRTHALRLLRSLLSQRSFVFTDLSPSGNVVAMNERLGFRRLDTSTRLVVNVPRPTPLGIIISDDSADLKRTLRGPDVAIYRDHKQTAAARHLLVRRGGEYAYLVFRVDRRKRLPLFASPLYIGGDPATLEAGFDAIRSHLLLRYGLPFLLAERRMLPFARGWGKELAEPRPKMVRGDGFPPESVDYLYSELALLNW
ncbi:MULTISPECIES: hypothetical protein [unclassified Microbacterium]|uniref:hypothetical protein n=1 Tax=unclassified Microbacterium TaxID=2609290 RepID=UPI00214BB560|nr:MULTISPECIES: hypothetical protein [unclassified Microbacterium]MCR2785001.1 hypothetical protein [Microbacterium sp. zg.B96]WIM16540.1 hypothetical protein QNO11_02550 [Microbacterium sp. zg-B96]